MTNSESTNDNLKEKSSEISQKTEIVVLKQEINERLIKDFSNLKIMVLDDNKLFRKYLYKLLEINYNIKSIEMENPKEALEYLKKQLPDLILLDMEMPYIDGYSFLKFLRKSDTTKNLPVLPITAINSKELIINLSKQNIVDFIIKTTTPDVMLEKFTKVFNKISS